MSKKAKSRWDFEGAFLLILFLLLAVGGSGCVYANQPSSSPTDVKLKIEAPQPQMYSVRVTRPETNDYQVDNDGLVEFSVRPFQNGCNVYLLGCIKTRDGSASNAPIIQVRKGDRTICELSIAQVEKQSTNEMGFHVVRIAGANVRERSEHAGSDLYFLPCGSNASVSFDGKTQLDEGIHRLEVRHMAFWSPIAHQLIPTESSCVIYYAGDEYGPSILATIDDCIDPLVRRASTNMVEIFYLTGAHTHIRQQWELLGYSAKLAKEDAIDWQEDPRMKDYPRE